MSKAHAPLVGMRYRPPALTILQGLGIGQELVLRREPENEYDENAIAVHLPEGWEKTDPGLYNDALAEASAQGKELSPSPMLGYIARDVAAIWAPVLDSANYAGQPFPPASLSFSASGVPLVSLEIEVSEEEEVETEET